MPQKRAERRLTTVLFLDIVGSTRIAAGIGDGRWRELLGRFRAIVRADLKRFGGLERDTTGDGFLATFDNPARAVEAADAIASSVHAVGLDVRAGVHTGEVESVDGSLAGIAVHLAARVMSLADAAQVFVTGTVKDLVIGSGIEFERVGERELKGVPGTWQIYSVIALHGHAREPALAEHDAAIRIAAVEPAPFLRRRRGLVVGVAVVVAVALAAGVVLALTRRPTITLLRLDAQGRVVQTLRDGYYSHHLPDSLWASDGSLWQAIPDAVVRRDPRTGDVQLKIPVESNTTTGAPGFGSVWTSSRSGTSSVVVRRDEASGRVQARLSIPNGDVVSMSAGGGAMWALESDGTLLAIDPNTTRVARSFETPTVKPGVVVSVGEEIWICDCDAGRYVEFDPNAGHVVGKPLTLPQRGFLVAVDRTSSSSSGQGEHSVWIVDPNGDTLTPLGTDGRPGESLGFGGHVSQAAIGLGALWVAASNAVYRVDLATGHKLRIEIPESITAGSVTVDERSGSVWVGNCGCPRNG